MNKTHSKPPAMFTFILTCLCILIMFFIAVNTGGIRMSISELFSGLFLKYDKNVAIIAQLRFPRIIVALMGGMIMSVSGVLMQAVMRNPLADPAIIGVSSGSALTSLVMLLLMPSLSAFVPLFSFFGGMAAFAVVYLLSFNGEVSPVRLILVGIAVDAVLAGIYQAFDAATGGAYTGAKNIINANISLKTWGDVKTLAIYTLIGALLCIFVIQKCNLLALSDQTIGSLGVNVARTRLIVAIVSVMLASIFTSVIGTVCFLGLIVPHIARLLVGSNHKVLVPYSALLGAFIFLLADTLGRSIAYPYEISSSIIMAVIGGPIFIILLKRSRGIYAK